MTAWPARRSRAGSVIDGGDECAPDLVTEQAELGHDRHRPETLLEAHLRVRLGRVDHGRVVHRRLEVVAIVRGPQYADDVVEQHGDVVGDRGRRIVGVERLLQRCLQPRREDLATPAREGLRDRAQVGVVDDPLDALIDVGCGVIGLGHAAPSHLVVASHPRAKAEDTPRSALTSVARVASRRT